jgi:hypothetical protein
LGDGQTSVKVLNIISGEYNRIKYLEWTVF